MLVIMIVVLTNDFIKILNRYNIVTSIYYS